MKKLKKLAKFSALVLVVCTLCVFGWAIAQPPEQFDPQATEIPRLPSLDIEKGNIPGDPASLSTEEYKSDPLFHEIQKMLLKGKEPSRQHSFSDTDRSQGSEDWSEARWHAVESILRAARLLEQDVADAIRKRKFDEAAQTQLAIRNLRFQASELLRKQ